ncbi:PocR ligand-binding domain-containing protein [Clostridium sp. PL3]|uniref:PocR ligand-binding domain-containing protein n=1 Tax=Clostridium thailandense TaxID=2794346 RepID=A0A949X2P1_9CLOT|nr:PocR ligand-binding domain-containing protein [Clostridium thailandense]MBV7273499.1 PocR ligand-binding domain-containing protein [Clostridium thailandense]
MNSLKDLKFSDIIDINTLKDIQDKLAKIVVFSAITVDIHGIPVCNENNFTPFCKLIRSSPKGCKNCISCDSQAGFMAMRDKKTRVYNCHTGLIDCAAPIILNDVYVGSVLGGQVLLKGQQTKDSIDLKRISEEYEIPLEKLEEAAKHIEIVESDYLQNCVEFYTFLANYIAEMGLHTLTQEKLLKESEEKVKLEQHAQKMQLKTIQAQINPHFLFNTLNTIARMALVEDAPQTEELIYNLSDLLRYNLKNSEEFPKLADEIANIKRYLSIQTLRYSDRISYEINIEKFLDEYRIPTMILQPLVENSLVHGLETKKEGGKITIKGSTISKKDILIEINDNGKGINSSILNLLNNVDDLSDIGLGIGLQNTDSRLKHYFGKNYGLKIESKSNVGTKVYIRIPKLK